MFYQIKILLLFIIVQAKCESLQLVRTSSGLVRGQTTVLNNNRVQQYLNIPYAEPPIGGLRFSKPVALSKPVNGIIDGTKTGNACFQWHNVYYVGVPQSEDCLVLNVWTKQGTNRLKPVMFYIHGGSNDMNTIFQSVFNGTALATYDVVVVTANFRLNLLGFLYGGTNSVPGNMAYYDQLLALHWVKNNIHLFGGDPGQITILGQSSGSWSVGAHILSPLSRGMFRKAILESGALLEASATPEMPKSVALNQTNNILKYFNCPQNERGFECLRRVDARDLNAYQNFTALEVYGTEFLPLTAQDAFKSGEYNREIEIMAGLVRNEGSFLAHISVPGSDFLHSEQEFEEAIDSMGYRPTLNSSRIADFYLTNVDKNNQESLKQAFYKFYGDIVIICPTYFFSKLFAASNLRRNVYFYYWTYVSRLIADELLFTPDMGVAHGSDVPYVFGEPVLRNMSDKHFSEYIMKIWTNFAKTGNPLEGFPSHFQWPRLIQDNFDGVARIKELNPSKPNEILSNLFSYNCDNFWRNHFI